jgi:hypothetical protein
MALIELMIASKLTILPGFGGTIGVRAYNCALC